MSSTEYRADLEDILFLLKDVINVGILTKGKELSDFDMELFEDIIKEGINFAEQKLSPLNKVGDQEGVLFQEGKATTPKGFKELWQEMCVAGWLSMTGPLEFGGQFLPESISIAVRESFIAANPAFSLYSILTNGAARLIHTFGSEEQKRTYCEKMYSGIWSGTMCLTEPHAGSFLADCTSLAVPSGNKYKIKGTKIFITGGDHDMTENIVHLVLARFPDVPAGVKSLSLFIVPKYRMEKSQLVDNDVTTISLEHKMGIKGSSTAVLQFGDQRNCLGQLLGEKNQGMKQMFQMMNEARLQIGIQGVGQAGAAFQNAKSYAMERIQGISISEGKNPKAEKVAIIHHPDIVDSLTYMKTMTEAIRSICYFTAFYIDCSRYGADSQKEYFQDLADLLVPIAKAFSTDEGLEVVTKGIQVLGGVGYTQDFPLEQNYRDLRIAPIYEGTNAIQTLDLMSRKLKIDEGRLVKNLIKEFETIDMEAADSELLRESIGIWREFVASLILLEEDLKKIHKEKGIHSLYLQSKNIMRFFGDVISCFFLIKSALVAERKLKEIGVSITDLEEKAHQNSDVQLLFNKLLTAEYYALSILPRQEGYLRILKRSSTAALNTIFF